MSLTLLALFGLPLCLKMVLDPAGSYKALQEWSKSSSLQFASTIGALMITVLIFSTSKVQFGWNWNSVLSWTGLMIALKGISHLFPSLVAWEMRIIKIEERLPMFGFFGLLLLLAMVYIDTQLI